MVLRKQKQGSSKEFFAAHDSIFRAIGPENSFFLIFSPPLSEGSFQRFLWVPSCGDKMMEGMGRVKLEGKGVPQMLTEAPHQGLGLVLGPLSRLVQTPRMTAVRLLLRNHAGHSNVLLEPLGPGQPVRERSPCPKVIPHWEDRDTSKKRLRTLSAWSGPLAGQEGRPSSPD